MAQVVSAQTLQGFIDQAVSPNVSLLATDQGSGYRKMRKRGYKHETVNHKRGEYVRGVVHTQNLDSFWSLLKRGIMGNYHHVSRAYLPLYLAEFTFRHNERNNPDLFKAVLRAC